MTKSTNYFSRVLCALLLCTGLVFAGCTEGPLGDDQNTEQGDNQNNSNENGGDNTGGSQDKPIDENEVISGPVTITIDKITATTVTFKGKIDVAEADRDFSIVTVRYSEPDGFSAMNEKLPKVSTTSFGENGDFTIVLDKLSYNTTYKYCVIAKVRTEETYSEKVMSFSTENISVNLFDASSITATTAQIMGIVEGLSESDKSLIEVGMFYSLESGQVENGQGKKVEATEISAGGEFSILLSNLTSETKYYYCGYVYQGGSYTYGTPIEFTTLNHPYDIQHDLNVSAATNLSSSGSANCYIVSSVGLYKYKAVKGNSNESVGSVASASIIWETFGTSIVPEPLDLISAFCYKDGYIAFQTADTFKEGNAVIAAKDADGTILWSWHIWLTDQPQEQVYYNNAGTMMDRNLGATSATPGDVGALGLLYQWGRKDPFLGSSSISYSTEAESTITWPSAVSSDSSKGTIAYATANPTTFIKYNSNNGDWYYTGSSSTDNTRWTTSETSKSIYDPCPAGWRVPDGGANGVWSKAKGSSSWFGNSYNSTNKGMNFSGKLGFASTIWYPASGYRNDLDGGQFGVGYYGRYWSASPNSCRAYYLNFYNDGFFDPSYNDLRASGYSVRCLQDSK